MCLIILLHNCSSHAPTKISIFTVLFNERIYNAIIKRIFDSQLQKCAVLQNNIFLNVPHLSTELISERSMYEVMVYFKLISIHSLTVTFEGAGGRDKSLLQTCLKYMHAAHTEQRINAYKFIHKTQITWET